MYEVPRADDEQGQGCLGCLVMISFVVLAFSFGGVFTAISNTPIVQAGAAVAAIIVAGLLSYLIAQLGRVPQAVAFFNYLDRFRLVVGIICFLLLAGLCMLVLVVGM